MFEIEAKEYIKINNLEWELECYRVSATNAVVQAYQDGAEFGYNKAKEEDKWHYVKDGEYPEDDEYIMIYSKFADNIAVGKRRCVGKIRKRSAYEWYFATYDGTYALRDKDIIAWKEIVFPKESEKK